MTPKPARTDELAALLAESPLIDPTRMRADRAEAKLALVVEALKQAEMILSDGDYGEDVDWRSARDAARLALADGAESTKIGESMGLSGNLIVTGAEKQEPRT